MAVVKKEVKSSVTKKPVAAKKPTTDDAVPVGVADDVAGNRKSMVGVVTSNKMKKTIVVKVDRRTRHAMYKKYVNKSRKFKAHDERNEAQIGDLVQIRESRPLSRDKRWTLQKIIRRGGQLAQLSITE